MVAPVARGPLAARVDRALQIYSNSDLLQIAPRTRRRGRPASRGTRSSTAGISGPTWARGRVRRARSGGESSLGPASRPRARHWTRSRPHSVGKKGLTTRPFRNSSGLFGDRTGRLQVLDLVGRTRHPGRARRARAGGARLFAPVTMFPPISRGRYALPRPARPTLGRAPSAASPRSRHPGAYPERVYSRNNAAPAAFGRSGVRFLQARSQPLGERSLALLGLKLRLLHPRHVDRKVGLPVGVATDGKVCRAGGHGQPTTLLAVSINSEGAARQPSPRAVGPGRAIRRVHAPHEQRLRARFHSHPLSHAIDVHVARPKTDAVLLMQALLHVGGRRRHAHLSRVFARPLYSQRKHPHPGRAAVR
eukprot:scaffold10333_cov64-Phaeocystis_antarctica.AAC.2